MKKILILVLALIITGAASAQFDKNAYEKQRQQMQDRFNQQKNKAQQQFDDKLKKAVADYEAFRQRANEQYAAAMQRAWKQMDVKPAVPRPKEPEPPKQTPPPDTKPTTNPLPQSEVVPVPEQPKAVPAPPIRDPGPATPTMQFNIYGTRCSIHTATDGLTFKLQGTDDNSLAATWKTLAQKNYDGILHDCLSQRDNLHLGDWGYMRLLEGASEKLLGKGTNEAVMLQMYLLTQSGYNVRLAKSNNKLLLLMPFNNTIYNYSYIPINGQDYYIITKDKGIKLSVCDLAFPKEQIASIQMSELPVFNSNTQPKRKFSAQRFGTMTAQVGVDKGLIDFMNDYPLSSAWEYYSRAGLSETVKSDLYPALRTQIEGKSKQKAALMLLDFVQHAFQYATDDDQFGYERPLFGDESFYYPYNDCEDRSILYSILVRDLLGLDVVLVHWPGHLATAVAFPEGVEGDYFTIDGRRFTVCDPTYIGAGIGQTMDQFKNAKAKIVKL